MHMLLTVSSILLTCAALMAVPQVAANIDMTLILMVSMILVLTQPEILPAIQEFTATLVSALIIASTLLTPSRKIKMVMGIVTSVMLLLATPVLFNNSMIIVLISNSAAT